MILATHCGTFHLDEIIASTILLKLYPDAKIVRTRDEAIVSKADIVYDVGGIFNVDHRRFDHHQAGFFETFSDKFKIKLSSAGLIFKYYHEQLLSLYGITKPHPMYSRVVHEIYRKYFLSADAIDNGYDVNGEIVPRSIADLVKGYNIYSDEEDISEKQYSQFMAALKIIQTDFDNFMNNLIYDWLPVFEYLDDKIRSCEGEILCVDKFCHTDVLLEIEKLHKKDIKFLVFRDKDAFRGLAIPKTIGHFATKTPFKKEWRGLRDQDLCNVSGISGCVFVHASGFLGINKTKKGILDMCRASLRSSGTRCNRNL